MSDKGGKTNPNHSVFGGEISVNAFLEVDEVFQLYNAMNAFFVSRELFQLVLPTTKL